MATVLVLPGWGTSTRRLACMVDALARADLDARAWSYEAHTSIDRIAQLLAEETHDARADGGGPVHLVGHSLGGLASASAVLDHDAEVASVTTINSPWRGTWVAWTAEQDEPLGRELRWRSPRLAALRSSLADHLRAPQGPRWTLLAAAMDPAATPASSLRVPGGARLVTDVVAAAGHSLSLIKQPMIDRVVHAVTDADRPATGA